MTVKTIHQDTHGDNLAIYNKGELIFIDGIFDSERISWRGIYSPEGAREIAKRLNDLADIMEGK